MNAARTPHQPGPPRPRGGLRSRSEAWFASLTDSRDRQRAALGRQRRIVGAAKVILPALAAILLVAIVIFPGLRSGARFGRVTYREMPGSNAAALSRLTGAQYRGIDARGEKFTITASHAVQSGGDQLDLDRPKGDITTRSGSWFMLDASNGVYHQKSQRLDLAGKVTLYRADGTTMRTRRATIDIKAGVATGKTPVSAYGPFGTLTAADGFVARNHGQTVTFTGPSHLVLDQANLSSPPRTGRKRLMIVQARRAAALLLVALPGTAVAQSLGFGPAGGQPTPIDITAQNGIAWNQKTRIVTASGNAKAVRGSVTVTADQLVAHYSPAPAGAGKPAAPQTTPQTPQQTPPATGLGGLDSGASQITRLEAVGHVHIFTATEQAFGDLAVYHMSRHELVLTGHGLRLVTPSETVTATRALQYWSDARKAVAIGHARVVGKDGRSVTADRLTGYFAPAAPAAKPQAAPVTKAPAGAPPSAAQTDASKLRKVVAEGHVVVTTQSDVATGDHGVYHPASGIAILTGNVHITHGPNELAGQIAQINMKTGIATLVSRPGQRVEGLIIPDSTQAQRQGAAKSPHSGAKAAR